MAEFWYVHTSLQDISNLFKTVQDGYDQRPALFSHHGDRSHAQQIPENNMKMSEMMVQRYIEAYSTREQHVPNLKLDV